MDKPTLQASAIQKALGLSEQDAMKVLVFIMGMHAGKQLQDDDDAIKTTEQGRKYNKRR